MTHGITLTESTTGTRTISTRSSAIIGLIGTSTAIAPEDQAALDAAFPSIPRCCSPLPPWRRARREAAARSRPRSRPSTIS
jgi:phage tail sheath protein FI